MTRLVLGYDGSAAARAAIAAAAALFPGAEVTVVTVRAGALAAAQGKASEGVALAQAAGLQAHPSVLAGASPSQILRGVAGDLHADVLACGTRGEGPLERSLLGSTASSVLHHAECPLLVVPAGDAPLDGPVLAGYDGSDGARRALRFAAAQLPDRPVLVAHAWRSPVRHTLRGHALTGSHVDVFEDYAESIDAIWCGVAEETAEEGAAYARELGLSAFAVAPESGRGDWRTLLRHARHAEAAAMLVGSRGRGAVAATAFGSVASGLVHAAALPVLVVPAGGSRAS